MFHPVGVHICAHVYLSMFKVFHHLCVTTFEVSLKVGVCDPLQHNSKGKPRNERERGELRSGRRLEPGMQMGGMGAGGG